MQTNCEQDLFIMKDMKYVFWQMWLVYMNQVRCIWLITFLVVSGSYYNDTKSNDIQPFTCYQWTWAKEHFQQGHLKWGWSDSPQSVTKNTLYTDFVAYFFDILLHKNGDYS